MIMHWPQIVYVTLLALSLGVNLAKHGQPHPPTNFGHRLTSTVVTVWLLYAGGFFTGGAQV